MNPAKVLMRHCEVRTARTGLIRKVRLDTTEVLEENTGRKISHIPHGNTFTDTSPRAREIKERINKWYCIKRKSFCTAKENIKWKRSQLYRKTYLLMIPRTRA